MERSIIRIDEEKCDGCGLCCQGCPEGSLQVVDGKARLVSEITCDGLGACLGACPRDAIVLETREALPYDERAALAEIVSKGTNTLLAHLRHLHEHAQNEYLRQALEYLQEKRVPVPEFRGTTEPSGCPGSSARTLVRPKVANSAAAPDPNMVSQLTQWPVQLHLISPSSPAFANCDLLLAADCTAFAMADFNQKWLPGKKLAIACPKLDHGQEVYLAKLTALIDEARINTITVLIMEVPCCGGLLRLAQRAAAQASRRVPVEAVIVGVDGEVVGARPERALRTAMSG